MSQVTFRKCYLTLLPLNVYISYLKPVLSYHAYHAVLSNNNYHIVAGIIDAVNQSYKLGITIL